MKIVVIVGSPRREGNTVKITQKVEQSMKKCGDVEFEYIFLKEADIQDCTGCFVCFLKGEENCPLKDDRAIIEQKLMDADGTIFASPVYSLQVSYLMKKFLDRNSFIYHRPRFFGKYSLAISTAAGPVYGKTLKYMKNNSKHWGYHAVDTLGVVAEVSESAQVKVNKKIDKIATKFYNSIDQKKVYKPSLSDLIYFRIWKTVNTLFPEWVPPDHQYWSDNGWLASNYYYDVNINFLKLGIANILEKVMKFFMKRSYS